MVVKVSNMSFIIVSIANIFVNIFKIVINKSLLREVYKIKGDCLIVLVKGDSFNDCSFCV